MAPPHSIGPSAGLATDRCCSRPILPALCPHTYCRVASVRHYAAPTLPAASHAFRPVPCCRLLFCASGPALPLPLFSTSAAAVIAAPATSEAILSRFVGCCGRLAPSGGGRAGSPSRSRYWGSIGLDTFASPSSRGLPLHRYVAFLGGSLISDESRPLGDSVSSCFALSRPRRGKAFCTRWRRAIGSKKL